MFLRIARHLNSFTAKKHQSSDCSSIILIPQNKKSHKTMIITNLQGSNNPLLAKSAWSSRRQMLGMLNLKEEFQLLELLHNDYIKKCMTKVKVSHNSTCNMYNRKLTKLSMFLQKCYPKSSISHSICRSN